MDIHINGKPGKGGWREGGTGKKREKERRAGKGSKAPFPPPIHIFGCATVLVCRSRGPSCPFMHPYVGKFSLVFFRVRRAKLKAF